MERIAIERAYRPIEVDLWGHVFATVDLTRSSERKKAALESRLEVVELKATRRIRETQGKLAATEDEAEIEELSAQLSEQAQDEAALPLFADLFDVLFEPVGHGTKASTVIKRKWRENKLGIGRVLGFLGQLQAAQRKAAEEALEEAVPSGRPT